MVLDLALISFGIILFLFKGEEEGKEEEEEGEEEDQIHHTIGA